MQSNQDSAEEIATAISRGDSQAETLLVERYYRIVLYILKKRVQDENQARDLCQETFRITLERLRSEPLSEPDKLPAFLHSVASFASPTVERRQEDRLIRTATLLTNSLTRMRTSLHS